MSGGRNLVVERSQAASFTLTAKQAQIFFNVITTGAEAEESLNSELPAELFPYESLADGLQPYF